MNKEIKFQEGGSVSYPVGTVMILRGQTQWEVPVWIKTAQGWLSVIPSETRTAIFTWVTDSDFENEWEPILPTNVGGSNE